MLKHALGVSFVKLGSLYDRMSQHQATIAGQIDVDDFDIGIEESDIVLPRQFTANAAIAPLVMDGVDPDAGAFLRIIMQMKHAKLPHQPWAEKLNNETFIAVVGPNVA